MIKRLKPGEYEFRLRAPAAHEVFLVGEFGYLAPQHVRMSRCSAGEWSCRLPLSEGAYQFKYWVDGHWRIEEDPEAEDAAPFLTSSILVSDESTVAPAYLG